MNFNLFGRYNDGMANHASGIFKARPNIISFEVGKIGENFLLRCPLRQHLENIGDANPHAANARPAVALFRLDRDAR